MSPVSVTLEVSLCKREGKISRKDMVHNIVHVGSLYKPLPLVTRVTRLPTHLTLLLHLRPCAVHGNRHSGVVRYDEDLCLLVHSHSTVEKLTCSEEGRKCVGCSVCVIVGVRELMYVCCILYTVRVCVVCVCVWCVCVCVCACVWCECVRVCGVSV